MEAMSKIGRLLARSSGDHRDRFRVLLLLSQADSTIIEDSGARRLPLIAAVLALIDGPLRIALGHLRSSAAPGKTPTR
jgi:hypothetical protein